MKVVIVGFKVAEENSVFYSKKELLPEAPLDKTPQSDREVGEIIDKREIELMGRMLLSARKAGAEFASVRFIK